MEEMTAKIESVNVTEPRVLTLKGTAVATSIYKRAALGKIQIDRLGIVGETRIAKSLCEPEDHAVYFYPHEHYAYWQAELACEPFSLGQFGENVTCTGLLETEVRLGDVMRCGSITVQVRQPRLPCVKLDVRMGRRFAGRFLRSSRVGFITRVLEPGAIEAGDAIEVIERDPREPTVEQVVRLTQLDAWDAEGLAALLTSRHLPQAWREIIEHKLELAREAEGWHGLRSLVVVRREPLSGDAVALSLACRAGKPLAAFRPGQYLVVAFRPDPEVSAVRRPYAITSDPRDLSVYQIIVQRLATAFEGGAVLPAGVVSTALREQVEEGEVLWATAPRGRTTLAEVRQECRGLLLISEGIGVATVLPLLREWARRLAHVPAVHLHVSRGEPMPLAKELAEIAQPTLRRLVVTRVEGEEGALEESSSGVSAGASAGALASQVRELAAGAEHVFGAGSSAFSEELADWLAGSGAALHLERFGELR